MDEETRRKIMEGVKVLLPQEKKGFDERALAEILKKKIVAQDKTVDQICSRIKRRLVQADHAMVDLDKPLGVFLLTGPAGVGKTYFCRVLGQNMYDGKGKLLHVDMSEMSEAYSKSHLIGSPQGSAAGGGLLTDALQKNPDTIVLLDMFEKAHQEVQRLFVTAWQNGFITDARSTKQVSTTKALFLVTTIAAADRLVEIEQSFGDDPKTRDKSVQEALEQAGFAPELLSCITHTFVFERLDKKGLARLASLEILNLANKYGLKVAKIDVDYLVALISDHEDRGGRTLSRVVDVQLGDLFIDAKNNGGTLVRVSLVEGAPFVRILEDN
jgi:ATP-dependent Clp protease ATP-binding subunit ClpA